MKVIPIFLLASLISSSAPAGVQCICKGDPPGCQPPARYAVCLTRPEAEKVAGQQIELEQLRAQQKAGRFGFTVGPGFGISGIITDDYDVKWVPAGGAYLVWGWRF